MPTDIIDIVVPQIGEAVSELRLVAWRKNVGDTFRRGDVLFEVDSDKAIVDVEAFVDGTLVEILFPDGSSVMPQQVVARARTAAEAAETMAAASQVQEAPENAARAREAKISPVAQRLAAELRIDIGAIRGSGPNGRITADDVRRYAERHTAQPESAASDTTAMAGDAATVGSPARVFASPKARRMARELQLDLRTLQGVAGSGVDGLIVARDVIAAATKAPPAAEAELPSLSDSVTTQAAMAGPTIPMTRLQHTAALRTQASKQQVPHFYLMMDVNMAQVNALRAYCIDKLRWERAPTYTDIITRACALTIEAMPEVNRSFSPQGLLARQSVGIGVAVATDAGLLVPTIPNANKLSLRQTSEALRSVAERARGGRLKPDDLGEKSMTISNLGMYGVDTFVAIIDMPDPMILAVGRTSDRVVPVKGAIAVLPMCTLTLSVDHRVLDGVQGAVFLGRIRDHLENPFELLA